MFAPLQKKSGKGGMFGDPANRGGRKDSQFAPPPAPGKNVREIEPEREEIEKIVRVFGF